MNNEIILDSKAVEEVRKVIGGGGDAPDSLTFGTLTENGDSNLTSSLSYSDILDNVNNGKTVILQYTEILPGEEEVNNNYYYAINFADMSGDEYIFEGVPFKQQPGNGGSIKWDGVNQTFMYEDGAM